MARKKSKPGEDNVRYEVITQEDENGDLILPLPPPLLKKMGWKEGDELEWSLGENGAYTIRRVNK
jgi:hypothetical protein